MVITSTPAQIKLVSKILTEELKSQIIFESLQFVDCKEYRNDDSKLRSRYFTFAIIRKDQYYPDAVSYEVMKESYQISCHSRKISDL